MSNQISTILTEFEEKHNMKKTYHGKDIRVINTALTLRLLYFLVLQHESNRQAKIGAEGMNEH